MNDDPYVYPGTAVLRNRLNIREADELERVERQLVVLRSRRNVPIGSFDLEHLKAIHRHLFQDIYDWAGEVRRVEISKEGHAFQFRRYIGTGMADVHRRLERDDFLRGLRPDAFASKAGEIIGDVNYAHPFREGNGRTQLQYLKQLCEQAGHPIDLRKLDPRRWLDASRAAHRGEYEPMGAAIRSALRAATER